MAQTPAWLAPVAAIVGIGLGYALFHALSDPVKVVVQEPQVIKQELTEEELAAFCEETNRPHREALSEAQARVETLQSDLEEREAELEKLRAEMKKRDAAGKKVAARIRELEQQVEDLQQRLAQAEQERDQALEQLKETVKQLNEQIRKTEHWKAEAKRWKRKSTKNLWAAFAAEAKVKICDRGSRRRHARCHEAVEAALTLEVRNRFEKCVDTWQSTPLLVKAERGEELPQYAEWLDSGTRFTRNWYIQFCDPTLPEATSVGG